MTIARHDTGVRGQPLIVLGAIIGGWLLLRLLTWQSPFDPPALARLLPHLPTSKATVPSPRGETAMHPAGAFEPRLFPTVPGPTDAPNARPAPAPMPSVTAEPEPVTASSTRMIGQQLLLAAAFANLALPSNIVAYLTESQDEPATDPPLAKSAGPSRWSGDAWLLWRRDASGPLSPGEPSYGRSQVGAVLRYRLVPASGHRPVAYVRVTRALAGPHEAEAAAGLAVRPLSRLPISFAAEARVSDQRGRSEVRPAAFAVTELPPVNMPFGLRAEGYAQAGYVGGAYATAFIDGQARLDALLLKLDDDAGVRAGAGIWGGAQKHSGRLDVGPTASISFPLGAARSRIAVDYRVRVAGEATPASGPSLTLSAGF